MKTVPDDRIAHVYLLESGGFYKIGFSYDPLARARRLSTGSPLPIRIVHTIRTAFHESIEAMLHRRFRTQRIRGEWFDLSDTDVLYIKSLDRNGYTPEENARFDQRQREPVALTPVVEAMLKIRRTQPAYQND